MSHLEERFTSEMENLYHTSSREIKYRPKFLLQWTKELGRVGAARKLLNAGGDQIAYSGLTHLYDAGRLDLTSEALMLKPEFAPLFTEAELAQARAILKEYKYTAPWDKAGV